MAHPKVCPWVLAFVTHVSGLTSWLPVAKGPLVWPFLAAPALTPAELFSPPLRQHLLALTPWPPAKGKDKGAPLGFHERSDIGSA
jgi:hypothetical protein